MLLYIDISQSPIREDGVGHIRVPTVIRKWYILKRDSGETRCISAIILRTLGEDRIRINFHDCIALGRRKIGCDSFHDVRWSRGAVVISVRGIRPDQFAITIELGSQRYDRHSCSESKLSSNNKCQWSARSGLFDNPLKAYVAESIEKDLSISQE